MSAVLRIVPSAPTRARPLIKWAGGKRWFVREFGDDMFRRVLERGGRYIEPFVGSGAMALHLGLSNMVLGDAEEEIANLHLMVRDRPEDLVTLLRLLEEGGTDSVTYYRVRERNARTDVERAAKLLYLNRLGFNGLYRKNRTGKFNVPYGGSRPLHTRDRVIEASKALRGARIERCDALELIKDARGGDTLYVDPPYLGTFSDYTVKGFDEADHTRLADALRKAHGRGAEIYAHNVDTPTVRELYAWAEIIPMVEKRSISANGGNRGKVQCILAVGTQEEP